jgi:alginate production protein
MRYRYFYPQPSFIMHLLLLFCLFSLMLSGPAAAQTPDASRHPLNPDQSYIDYDAPPTTTQRLGRYLSFGGRVELETYLENNFDLNGQVDDDLFIIEPTLTTGLEYDPPSSWRGYLSLKYYDQMDVVDEGRNKRHRSGKLTVSQLYGSYHDLFEGTVISVGRQRFVDERKWIYEENIDALRFGYVSDKVEYDLSLSWQGVIGDNMLNHDDDDRADNYVAHMIYKPFGTLTVEPHILYRYGREGEWVRMVFAGLLARGAVGEHIDFWQQLAWVSGKEKGINRRRGTYEIIHFHGVGLDIGGRYAFDQSFDPTLFLGFAFGEGGDDPDEHTGFRQSGLQENSGKLTGLTSVDYYGELFNPELSNLFILTAGAGIEPVNDLSLELIYHYYRQHRAMDEIFDADADADPDGVHKGLGQEFDLVLGYRYKKNFDASASLGMFLPGTAFPEETDKSAYSIKVKCRYKF